MLEDQNRIEQIVNQINKIIEVISTELFLPKDVIDKELILIILKNKKAVDKLLKNKEHDVNIRLLKKFNNNYIMELIGEVSETEHVLAKLKKSDIIRMVHGGSVAIKL